MSLNGKKIVVTGASKGLGLGIVKRLADEGADIIAHYNSGDITEAQNYAQNAGAKFTSFKADLSKEAEILKLADDILACGDIYGLVNNAGVCIFQDYFNVTPETFDFTFNVNIKSIFLLTQKIGKQMADKGIKGRIINFSSITATSGSATQVDYGAAKGAVSAFTNMCAVALGKYGITVNELLPGPIPTKHNTPFLVDDTVKAGLYARMPLACYGEPENIADAVVYFLEEKANWTTGAHLAVDGGYLSR